MLLTFTSSRDATADYLLRRVEVEGLPSIRVNTDVDWSENEIDLGEGGARLRYSGCWIDASAITAVWYRRPKRIASAVREVVPRRFSEQEWTAGIEGFLAYIPDALWISHPSRIAGASQKPEQLLRARTHGLNVPRTIVTTSTSRAAAFVSELGGTAVAKPLMYGYIEAEDPQDDAVVYTNRITLDDLGRQGSGLGCPTIVQAELQRGYDVRISVVDETIVAVALVAPDGRVDIRRNNMTDLSYRVVSAPEIVHRGVLSLVKSYGLRFAAIDMIVDRDGAWYFLELNPNGQWAWLDEVASAEIYRSFLWSFGMSRR